MQQCCCDLNKSLQDHINELNTWKWNPIQKKLKDEIIALEKTKLRIDKTCCKTPEVVQLLQILCRSTNSKKVVELDAHLGCVTLNLALNGLTNDGHLWTWDRKEENINKLKDMLKEANLENKVTLNAGNTEKALDKLIADNEIGKLDMIILNGDKKNIAKHLEKALKLVKTNGLICINRVLSRGNIVDEKCVDEETKNVREMNKWIHDEKKIDLCCLGIADGLTILLKRE